MPCQSFLPIPYISVMDFKSWFLATEITDTGEAERERPELHVTALPIINRRDEPPKPKKSPLARYVVKKPIR
jgi:hypothetical protein